MSAADRGWGPAPVDRSRMVAIAAGASGVNFPGGVHRQIAPLVIELVIRIEQETGEKAVDGWCWGYAPRRIGTSNVWSNHAWGLAIDYNAPKHPQYRRGTWGGHERAVSRIAADLGFVWGGDWSDARVDEMHFEFAGTPTDAARLIAQLEDDMTPEQARKLDEVHEAVFGEGMVSPGGKGPFPDPSSIRGALTGERSGLFAILDLLRKVRATQLGQTRTLDTIADQPVADVDVAELADALSDQLGDDVAAALGRRLAG